MKSIIALLLAVGMCISLCACDNNQFVKDAERAVEANRESEPPTTISPELIIVTETSPVIEATEESKLNLITENYPVIVLDNEYVKITVEDKYSKEGTFQNFGYDIFIENKCDKHIMLVPSNCSIDGFMLATREKPRLEIFVVAPNKKAKTIMYYSSKDTADYEFVKTVDDLVNLDGQWQISFSDNGKSFGNHQKYNFDSILP